MEHTLLDSVLKYFAGTAGVVMIGVLLVGWFKGLYWEQQLKTKRRHR